MRFTPFIYWYSSISVLAGLLILAGCDSTSITDDSDLSSLTNTTWQLRYQSENGKGVTAPVHDSLYTLRFSEDGSLWGDVHCNFFEGSYDYGKGNSILDITIGAVTLRACTAIETDIPYLQELEKIRSYEIDGDHGLKVSYKENGVLHSLHFTDADDTSPKKAILAKQDGYKRNHWAKGAYRINQGTITEDTLYIDTSYSGCDYHDFNLVFTSYFLESYPVQAYAILPNKSEDCGAIFNSTLSFDLSPLKEAYLDSYGSSRGEQINLSIVEDGEKLFSISYSLD